MTAPRPTGISTVSAAALGIGGMIGSGIFTLLGLAGSTAGSGIPIAFIIGAVVASFSIYSYAKLGAVFPSRGGAAEFLRRSFPSNLLSGGANVFQYLAYLTATALYAAGFAEYARVLGGNELPAWSAKAIGVLVVVVFAAVNVVGQKVTARAEALTVGFTLVILALLVVIGAWHADPSLLRVDGIPSGVGILTAAGLLYVNYQGFGVVTNTSASMHDPKRQLPRAMFSGLVIVAGLYVLVSLVTVLVLPVSQIMADSGHVLATVATAISGRVGFVVVSVAAILASAAAVNATVFAASSIASDVARNGQLPRGLGNTTKGALPNSLVLSTLLVIALVLFFPLASVGQMTSLAFLAVYAMVSIGHLRVRSQTGAKAWPLIAAIACNAVLFALLLVDSILNQSPGTWVTLLVLLIGSFVLQAAYQRHSR